jgi:hypothetical protein
MLISTTHNTTCCCHLIEIGETKWLATGMYWNLLSDLSDTVRYYRLLLARSLLLGGSGVTVCLEYRLIRNLPESSIEIIVKDITINICRLYKESEEIEIENSDSFISAVTCEGNLK